MRLQRGRLTCRAPPPGGGRQLGFGILLETTRTSSSLLAGTASCRRRAPTRASSHNRLSEACAAGCWGSDVLPGEEAPGSGPACEPGACTVGCCETAAASTCSSSRSGCWVSACSAAWGSLLLPAKSSAAGDRSALFQEPSQDGGVGRMAQEHRRWWAQDDWGY